MCVDAAVAAGGVGSLANTNLSNLTAIGQRRISLPSATSVPVVPGVKIDSPVKPIKSI